MIWFIVGIVILVLIIIVCAFILMGLSKEEKNFMEVSDQYLKNIGKSYTKDQYARWAFEFYKHIISEVQNENYAFLREALSDDIYNSYLIGIKNAKDRNLKNVVEKMKPEFSRLVSLVVKDDLEIAKVWMRVSYYEYTIDASPIREEDKDKVPAIRVVQGSKDRRLEKEYILTLVKGHTDKESVACPNCGYITNIVSQNACVRCGADIVNRRYHWVVIGKEEVRNNR